MALRRLRRTRGSLIKYLLETYGNGKFQPPQTKEPQPENLYDAHFADGSLMPLSWIISCSPLFPQKYRCRFVGSSDLPNIVQAADLIEKEVQVSNRRNWRKDHILDPNGSPTAGLYTSLQRVEKDPGTN
ncbi:hypothetical protein FRC18_004040 [Serendipita sp. 400]|nr:hypothetical protein FRC18_004040 [Serendipita sp. 400]